MEHKPAHTAPASSASSPPPGRISVAGRTVRLLLRRLIYTLTVLFRPLRRFAGVLVVAAVLLGVIGYLSFLLLAPATAVQRDTRTALIPPSQAVENYIKGRQNYNAELMWAAFSPDLQARNLQSGKSKENLQAQVDQERTMGVRFNSFEYVGGADAEDGNRMFFYSAKFQLGNETVAMPTTFRVDADGRVTAIYAIEPLQLMQSN